MLSNAQKDVLSNSKTVVYSREYMDKGTRDRANAFNGNTNTNGFSTPISTNINSDTNTNANGFSTPISTNINSDTNTNTNTTQSPKVSRQQSLTLEDFTLRATDTNLSLHSKNVRSFFTEQNFGTGWENQMATDIHRTCVMMEDARRIFVPESAVENFKSMFSSVHNIERVYEPLCLVSSQTILALFYEFLTARLNRMFALGGASSGSRLKDTDKCDISRQTLQYTVTADTITINYTLPLTVRSFDSPEDEIVVNSVNVKVQLKTTLPYSGYITYSVDLSGLRADIKSLKDPLASMRRTVYEYLKGTPIAKQFTEGPVNHRDYPHLWKGGGGGGTRRRSRKTKRLNRSGRTSRKTFVARRKR